MIIDAPPLLPVTDAGLLTVVSDGALLVVHTGRTRTEQVALAARNLENVDGTLLGFVMNMVMKKDLGSVVYGYGHGSYNPHYYYGEGDHKWHRRSHRDSGRSTGTVHAGSGLAPAAPSAAAGAATLPAGAATPSAAPAKVPAKAAGAATLSAAPAAPSAARAPATLLAAPARSRPGWLALRRVSRSLVRRR